MIKERLAYKLVDEGDLKALNYIYSTGIGEVINKKAQRKDHLP